MSESDWCCWLWDLTLHYGTILFAVLFLISFLTYTIPFLLHKFFFWPQNLKKKYNAKWALVTGGSSGIGRAIVEKLASQEVNVVIAALGDDLLENFVIDIRKKYPKLEFRSIPVNLADENAVSIIDNATSDIDVQLVFNNAGFIAMGFFVQTSIEKQMANLTVNSLVAIRLTHLFVNRMVAKKLKGCVIFTSSPAGQIPSPFATMYGPSKALITEFATSIAGELYSEGIDILVAHPSPVDTRFYSAPSTDISASIAFFRKTAAPPTLICDYMFRTVGRWTSIVDQGYFCFVQKMILKVIDSNFFAAILLIAAKSTDEYKTLKEREKIN